VAIRVGKGRASVTITGPIADGLEAQVRDALNGSLGAMEAEADDIIATTRRTWPIASGTSRDALHREVRVQPGGWAVDVVIATVDYAKFITSTKVGTQRDATRIRNPITQLRQEVRDPAVRQRIADAVTAAMGPQIGDGGG